MIVVWTSLYSIPHKWIVINIDLWNTWKVIMVNIFVTYCSHQCHHVVSHKIYFNESFLDLQAIQPSTGDIIYDSFHDNSTRQELETRVHHIKPVEMLLPECLSPETEKLLRGIISMRFVLSCSQVGARLWA